MSAMRHRPTRPPAPTLPVLDRLDQTHRRIIEVLDQLAGMLARLDTQGADDEVRKNARHVADFFASTARRHHLDEEIVVFPTLLASEDVELVQHVRRLQQDHGWLEEDWLNLSPQLEALAEGLGGLDVDLLREGVEIFAALYRDHIALEESIVYPAARRREAADEAADLGRRVPGPQA